MSSNPPAHCCTVGIKHEGEPTGKMFKIGNIDAYIAEPTAENIHRDVAIMYLPDVIGIWQNSQLMADQYAANGYSTIVVDLFNGDPIKLNRPEGFDFMKWVTQGSSGDNPHTKDAVDPIVKRAIAYLKEQGFKKIGSVGYCFGAKYVCRFMAGGKGIDVGYSAHPSFIDDDELSAITGPFSISAAETDDIFPAEKRHKSEVILQKTGLPYQINLFSGVAHGFSVRGDMTKQVKMSILSGSHATDMSGSLKDLSKSISTSLTSSSTDPILPLPDDLIATIHAYLDKHVLFDEADSQRLQEELLGIYQASVQDKQSRLAPFLAILRTIKPAIRGSGRLLQWWDKLSIPVLGNLGDQKALVAEAREALLGTLAYDEDEGDLEDAKTTSKVMAERLLILWFIKSKSGDEELDMHARFVGEQIQQILLAYGRKRPKDFLTLIDTFFVDKSHRIPSLSLLTEFVRHGPPHLDQVLETPLLENLLRCLQNDTSTRVISLSITALIMILPHIPTSASRFLPSLFSIYSRLLFWDRERKRPQVKIEHDSDEEGEESTTATDGRNSWDKLTYLLENDDETVPELLHYFTFLYGLYPINFMRYIRKPQKYLGNANFPGADGLDFEVMEIRQRSEPFRQVHILHENFFTATIESELTDSNRWMKSAAADVVAECMALYSPVHDSEGLPTRSKQAVDETVPVNVPSASLMEWAAETPFQSRNDSWRNTQSTAVAMAADDFLHEKRLSQTSNTVEDTPKGNPPDLPDSPSIHPQMLTSPSHNQLHDLVNGQKSTRGSIYQTLTNESVASLALSNNQDTSTMASIHVDAYLHSLTSREARDGISRSRSPSLRPASATDPNVRVAYLHREIQLLRNDLNFERYLKQQHLTAIGQLRNKQIKEARGEAEIQNLINSSSILRSKLEESKAFNLQLKKETEKSKTHSRKWESELSAKLRVLREEQKKWKVQREELKSDLQHAKERTEKLKQMVIVSEAQELSSRQKVQSVESNLDEVERLRVEVEKLTLTVRTYEAEESKSLQVKQSEDNALRRITILEMELLAREKELARATQAFDGELDLSKGNLEDKKDPKIISQKLIDEALAANTHRIANMQRVYDHLLDRYNELEDKFALERNYRVLHGGGDVPEAALLGGEAYGGETSFRRPTPYVDPDEAPQSSILLRCRHGPASAQNSPMGGDGGESSRPFSQSSNGSGLGRQGSIDSDGQSLDAHGKVKIKPQSEMRVYGRGGPQNIGKAKKDKAKEGDSKKEKKNVGGIRSYRGLI
ncbi:Hamartin protein-domain-containing protein [Amylocarpus encephaloides]|uniref:Hamartin protein-domain-containing protein n=1 Tax=Amylocarpus encephaloides TaxID=45428 RepID=A0A9P7YAH6_9HELO|nr:Hamartin protein-domain-containing protein [Amylocarpus encephaloides]